MVNLGPLKFEFSDRDRLLIHRLTESLSSFADQLKRYNDGPPATYAEASKTIAIPPGAGQYELHHEGYIRHTWPKSDNWHPHPNFADFLNCLSEKGIL